MRQTLLLRHFDGLLFLREGSTDCTWSWLKERLLNHGGNSYRTVEPSPVERPINPVRGLTHLRRERVHWTLSVHEKTVFRSIPRRRRPQTLKQVLHRWVVVGHPTGQDESVRRLLDPSGSRILRRSRGGRDPGFLKVHGGPFVALRTDLTTFEGFRLSLSLHP